jgi:hypothetical protein
VLLNHYLFFRYFSALPPPRQQTYDRYSTSPFPTEVDVPTFAQVAAFFGICVWLVPFGLFVSLSAGELVLPTIGSDGRIAQDDAKKAQGLVKQMYASVGAWIGDTVQALGWSGESAGRYATSYSNRYR